MLESLIAPDFDPIVAILFVKFQNHVFLLFLLLPPFNLDFSFEDKIDVIGWVSWGVHYVMSS